MKNEDIQLLFVYGDPKYYGRFGFNPEVAQPYIPPYKLAHPYGWQGIELSTGYIENTEINFTCVEALSKQELW